MKRIAVITLSTAFALPFLLQSEAWASCGLVAVSKGHVQIISAQTKRTLPAPAGSKICSGDTIVAGPDSRAKLKMEDGNELNISPDSKIVLENYQYNPAQNKKKVLLNVLQGKVRATTQHENMYNDKSSGGEANSFQVRTKSAVAGVRGTDFLTSYDRSSGKTDVVTFRGKVEFGQPGPGGSITNAVQVRAGQTAQAAAGRAPAIPRTLPAKELNKVNHESKSESGNNNSALNDGKGKFKTRGKSGSASGTAATAETGAANSGGTTASSSNGESSSTASSGNSNGAANPGPAASNGSSEGRAPASTEPGTPASPGGGPIVALPGPTAPAPMPGGPMIEPNDLSGGGPSNPQFFPPGPQVLPGPPQPPPQIPKCDFCNAVISGGSTKVNINITIPH